MAKKEEKKDVEFDMHVWIKPESENTVPLYTISIGRRAVCHYMPLDKAIECVREEWEAAVE